MFGFATHLSGNTLGESVSKTLAALNAGDRGLSDFSVHHPMKEQPGVDMPSSRLPGASLQSLPGNGLPPCTVPAFEDMSAAAEKWLRASARAWVEARHLQSDASA